MNSIKNLSVLRSVRGNLKGSLTRYAYFTEKLCEAVKLEALQVRIEKVDELFEKFNATQAQIYEFSEEKDYGDPEKEFEEFESKYFIVKSVLLSEIRERTKSDINAHTAYKSSQFEPASQNINSSNLSSHVDDCLPKLYIEPFEGNYKDWPAFRDMFESSVHQKQNLSNTKKFHFLRSCLRGEALNLLTHIPVSDDTYEQAFDRLVKRYDRPRYIINSLLETFNQLPSIQITNVKVLRKLSDGADEVVRGLDSLKSFERDPWMISILLSKLDSDTRQAWSSDSVDSEEPRIKDLLTFLERRCEALESCKLHVRDPYKARPSSSVRSMQATTNLVCPKCNALHKLAQCTEFAAMEIEARRDFIKNQKLCFNCLRAGHASVRCPSKFRCKSCNSRHHSLVHLGSTTTRSTKSAEASSSTNSFTQNSSSLAPCASSSNTFISNHSTNIRHMLPQTLLPTAVGKVLDASGNYQLVRVLIDSGSQVSFVTESCVQKLGLKRRNARIPITGIGAKSAITSKGLVSLVLSSRFNSANISVDTYILTNVTSSLPTISFDVNNWDYISRLELADPYFNQSNSIDVLLGADKVWEIFLGKAIRGSNGLPIAQATIFGWVLAGKTTSGIEQEIRSNHTLLDIDSILKAFWTIEEVDSKSILSKEDIEIEQHFRETHQRDKNGKYIVRLPFKVRPSFAGTFDGAFSRLKSMEKRFAANKNLAQSYSQFLDEYLALGHMEKVPSSEISTSNTFYLPHHAVIKPDSVSTKLRVVFDGSFKDKNGISLNDSLMIGPPIQRNLFSVCLRFRRHKYVFTADIVKMFRQIWVDRKDTDYQRIIWRKSPTDILEYFRLCTVTYGTSCAPYLSVRVLEQIAFDYRDEYPEACDILLNDFYVDDVVSGGDSLADVIFKKQCLIELLSKAGLELSKWQSNCKQLLPNAQVGQSHSISLDSNSNSWVKILGLLWNSEVDCFSFLLNIAPNEALTKRQILKEIARIFDPLGFLAPSVIQLKIILQELWHQNLNWDDPLPKSIATQWLKYRKELPVLTKISIPRSIGAVDATFELHGFSDASIFAYAAVIYSRFILPSGDITTTIVAAKTRVAPIKQLTIPRLELCGALLLARLLDAVQNSLNIKCSNVFAWCDSQVVLSWLSSPSRRWDTFVGNRTAEILNTIPRNRWYHVRSEENPADCASRGVSPSLLINHSLWWKGPSWLRKSNDIWPIITNFEEHPTCKQEEKKNRQTCIVVTNFDHPFETLASRVSSWTRLIRIVAFILRFISKCRKLCERKTDVLAPQEFYCAKREIIKWIQNIYFGKYIDYYKTNGTFGRKCKILNLNPFLDDDQILRVGGRLHEANITYNVKHPIIIPKGHAVTTLIAIEAHQRLLHPGVSTLFAVIRQEYWIIGCRNLLRKITHSCVKCFRQRKSTITQIMGNLPAQRIQPSRPFVHCGCDYAGPIILKIKIGRKVHTSKGYISLFVCLVTKAIHLELVSDLTTDAFLAAFRRFTARRGKPSHIYSDNGTNFHGSARMLSEMHQHTLSQHHNSIVAESLARDGITWHFIPPSAPHFGGLWEAGVKSVKQHLRRVIGSNILTFEEYYTLLTQIEALLNSRPLCQQSDNDLDPLTPAHFVLGESYSAVPEPSLDNINPNRLSCWQSIQDKVQGYWRRWSLEYLTSLQQRPRWSQPQSNIQLNDLVVIKDTNLPPGKWSMGRVTAIHPGKDGKVRVVTLKTANGQLLRPIHKLALLPLC